MHAIRVRSIMVFPISFRIIDMVINRCQYHDRCRKNSDEHRETDNESQGTAHAQCFHDEGRDKRRWWQYQDDEQ